MILSPLNFKVNVSSIESVAEIQLDKSFRMARAHLELTHGLCQVSNSKKIEKRFLSMEKVVFYHSIVV